MFDKKNFHEIRKFCQENRISYLALFGSRVRNEAREGSDVDLLVNIDNPKISLFDHVLLEEKLEGIFGRDVDLITVRSLNPLLRERILKEAQTIYERR